MALATTNPISALGMWEDPLTLLPRKKIQDFEREQAIYSPEDPADSLLLLVDGAVKISRISENGRETVLEVESRESFFGVSCLLGQPQRGELAMPLERSSIMEWPLVELHSLMNRTPDLGPALMRVVARKLMDADRRIESFANDHIPRRLLKALLRLGERFGQSKGSSAKIRMMPLTHELLARHVGTSREIVTQHMSQLRRRGLLDYSRSGLEFEPRALRAELDRIR